MLSSKSSGVIFHKDKQTYYFLTSAHIWPPSAFYAKIKTYYEEQQAELVKINYNKDLAIFKFHSSQDYPIANIASSHTPNWGDKVYYVGYPAGYAQIQRLDGYVFPRHHKWKYIQPLWPATIPVAPGMSGSPLYNEDNEVIGLMSVGITKTLNNLRMKNKKMYIKTKLIWHHIGYFVTVRTINEFVESILTKEH